MCATWYLTNDNAANSLDTFVYSCYFHSHFVLMCCFSQCLSTSINSHWQQFYLAATLLISYIISCLGKYVVNLSICLTRPISKKSCLFVIFTQFTFFLFRCPDGFLPHPWVLCTTSFNHLCLVLNGSMNFIIYFSFGGNLNRVKVYLARWFPRWAMWTI